MQAREGKNVVTEEHHVGTHVYAKQTGGGFPPSKTGTSPFPQRQHDTNRFIENN